MAMNICIIGAGAIGGLLGAKLALGGESVCFVEKSAVQRDAINANGLKLIMHDGTEVVAKNVRAYADCAGPGAQDLVIIAVKAHQIAAVAPELKKLYAKETTVMTLQNGLPWWYFQRHGGEFEGRQLSTLDPGGVIAANVEPERIVGCVVFPAASVKAPGVIQHEEGDRFSVGELDGKKTPRIQAIYDMIVKSGLRSFLLDNVRAEIWLKAWGNLSFNPISALTHATMVDIARYSLTRDLSIKMMEEAQTVANKLGITFRHTIERRMEGAEAVGAHKTSMLQDVEAGHALEIEALVGSIVELARITETRTPHIDAVYACTKLLDKVMGVAHAAVVLRTLG